MNRRFALSLLVATGCAQTIVVSDDDAGSRDGGLSAADTGVGLDGGTRDGGSSESDAGTRDGGTSEPPRDGGIRQLTWGQNTVPSNTRAIQAIWGRANGDIYAGSGGGALLRRGTVTWEKVWQEPSNHGIVGIGGTANRLFIASESRLHVFEGDHTTVPTSLLIPQVRSIEALLVVGDDEAYVVATLQNGRGFYRFAANQVQSIAEPTDVATLASLGRGPDGTIYVGANGRMYQYRDGQFRQAVVGWPNGWDSNQIVQFVFRGIGVVDGRVVAVGSQGLAFERETDGTFALRYGPFSGDTLEAVTGVGSQGVAVGEVSGATPIVRVDGTMWSSDPFVGSFSLRTVWAKDAETYFAGGFVRNGIDGVILQGAR